MTFEEMTRLMDAARGVEDFVTANLRRTGIRFDMAYMVVSINHSGGSLAVGNVGYYGTNRSYGMAKLTELGYIETEQNSADKRSKFVKLTKAGEALAKKFLDLIAQIEPSRKMEVP